MWLTNFLSEIRNLINPWWWVEQLFLSVKRCENSCKDISHIDDRLLPTCGKQMEKLLSEWFSGHFSYTALVGCPKERNNFLHSHKYTAWQNCASSGQPHRAERLNSRWSRSWCNQISTQKGSFWGDIWMHGSGMDPEIEHDYDNKEAKLQCNSTTYGRIPGQFFLSSHYFLQVATS